MRTPHKNLWPFFVDVVTDFFEGEYADELRVAFVGRPGLRWHTVEECDGARDDAILIWTTRLLADPARLVRLAQIASQKKFLVLPCSSAPISPEFACLRRLEWTNPADIYWQWRVACGAPIDHVMRPDH